MDYLNDTIDITVQCNAVENSSKVFCMQWKSLIGSGEKDGNLMKVFNTLRSLRMALSHYSLVVSKMLYIKQNNFSKEIRKF